LRETNNSGQHNNEPLEINCIKNRDESSSGIPNHHNSVPVGDNTMREKFDRRNSQAKTTRKREASQENARESSCTNRKNRDKSL